jgi:hypothetical protein
LAGFDCEHVGGKGQGEKGCDGGSAHGGEVAEAAGEAAVAYGFGGMAVATEVAVFEGKVCGYKYFGVRRRVQDGAVVAYSEGEDFASWGGETAAYLLDKR